MDKQWLGPRTSRVKKMLFTQIGGHFVHYLLENGYILYQGYTSYKKLSGNKYPYKFAIGDLVKYTPSFVQDMKTGKPFISNIKGC